MARSENQKLKLIYLYRYLFVNTDEENGVTMADILTGLKKNGISANRKTIYTDIETLREYGVEIEGYQKNGTYYYHIISRKFELAELKLLVDAVQSSKFITKKKSSQLIEKIEGLTSRFEAKQLQRQVFVNDRIKTMNESIYYNVDTINTAINTNSSINFQYYEWNLKKELVPRENAQKTRISPWALLWDNENYYLVAFDSSVQKIKHYRVDKMRQIKLTNNSRDGKEVFEQFNTALYTKKIFSMFGGKQVNVTLEFENHLIGVVIDRFGTDIIIIPEKDNHFRIHVEVEISDMFYSWIMGLGRQVRIIAPEIVVLEYKERIDNIKKMYQ